MNKQPERTALTKQSLIDAFWYIAEKQGIDKTTVSAIAKKAGVNRGTFYMYFEDINDIVRHAESCIICDLQSRIKDIISAGLLDDINTVTRKFVEMFTLYDNKLFIMLEKNGGSDFLNKIRTNAASIFKEVFGGGNNTPYSEYIIAYSSSAFIGLITYWHNEGRKIPVTELAGLMCNITRNGVYNTVFENDI